MILGKKIKKLPRQKSLFRELRAKTTLKIEKSMYLKLESDNYKSILKNLTRRSKIGGIHREKCNKP